MGKETYYFSHDYNSRNDPKIVKVQMNMGIEGIGLYWCTIEMLYEQSGYLNLNEIESHAFALRTKPELLTRLISDFDLFANDKTRFWSESVLRRLKLRNEKSLKAQNSANSRWQAGKDANAMRTHSEGNAIKERKGNKIKVKEIVNIPFNEFWNLYDKKISSKKAEVLWNNLSNDERVNAIDHIPKYKASQPDKQFRKDPATYLNNKSFNDEIVQNGKQISSYQQKGFSNKQAGAAGYGSELSEMLTELEQ